MNRLTVDKQNFFSEWLDKLRLRKNQQRYLLDFPNNGDVLACTGDSAWEIDDPYVVMEQTTDLLSHLYFFGFQTIITGAREGFDTLVFESALRLRRTGIFPMLRIVVLATNHELRDHSPLRIADYKGKSDYFLNLSDKFPNLQDEERMRIMWVNCSRLLMYNNSVEPSQSFGEVSSGETFCRQVKLLDFNHIIFQRNQLKENRTLYRERDIGELTKNIQ